ncbi:MAG: 1-acyl-sn-glycerol-3-phosphate acyltransferase [Rhodocyclaceae bacterium]
MSRHSSAEPPAKTIDGAALGARPRRWAQRLLARLGWQLALAVPPGPRVLVVVYPHTSNWDFPLGILARFACGWPIHWIGKHTLFRGPVGRLFRSWGGIPIDRSRPGGFVEGMVEAFTSGPVCIVAIAPEGTRSYVPCWKSGFYRIALAAGVPVGLGFIDYATRRMGILDYVSLSGDSAADMARIRDAYAGVAGLRPEHAGEIRFGDRPGASRDHA